MTVFVADERDGAADPAGATVRVDLDRLRRLAELVAADQRVPADMELSVLCVTTPAMADLNRLHMDGDGPTDVLAFPLDMPGETMPGAPAVLGDVVLCPDVAAEQAADAGHDPTAELEMLLVHGILHLLGHDHADASERREMVDLTERLLSAWRAQAGGAS